MMYAVELKTKKFKTLSQYFLWCYRSRNRWIKGRARHLIHVAESRRRGYEIRMERIRARKEASLKGRTMLQRLKQRFV